MLRSESPYRDSSFSIDLKNERYGGTTVPRGGEDGFGMAWDVGSVYG